MVVRVRLRDRVCAQASVGPQHAHTWTADKDFSRSPQAVRNKTRWSQPGVAACCDCSHSFGEEHGRKDRPRTRLPRASRLASVFSGSDSRQRAQAHARAHTHTHTYIHTYTCHTPSLYPHPHTCTHVRGCVAKPAGACACIQAQDQVHKWVRGARACVCGGTLKGWAFNEPNSPTMK